jgi:hypothetical protein
VLPEDLNNLQAPAIVNISFQFFESEVNDIVVMKFFGRYFFAEIEPYPMEQIDFFFRQPWGVRTEIKNLLLALGRVNFES